MKKLLIAVLAVAGLASCTNTVEFEPVQKQIGLSPITQNRTRAMVSGTAFPDEQFMVWAWYKQVDAGTTIKGWQAATTVEQQDYIKEQPFESKATTQNDKGKLWAGVTPYFWPKQGSLLFAGYYPASAASYVDYEFTDNKNVMTITNYSPTSDKYANTGFVKTDVTNNHSEDLMYFKMTEASCNSGTMGSEVDGVDDGNSVTNEPNVDVVFQHALAWIKVTLAKAEGTPEKATITVNSVSFTNVNSKGTGTVADNKDIAWESTTPETIVVWTEGATELGTTAIAVSKEPIIIPQEIGANYELVINYTITSKEDKEGEENSSFTETKTVKLANDTSVDSWEAGKCYTYAIAIGTSEILIDPKVTDWAEVEIPVEIK